MPRLLFLLAVLSPPLPCLPALAEQHEGLASFYSAVPDQSEKLSAAHRSLAFGTMVSVTRIDTGAHVVVQDQ